MHLFIPVFIYTFIHAFIYLFIYFSIYLCIYLRNYLFISEFIYTFIYALIYLFILKSCLVLHNPGPTTDAGGGDTQPFRVTYLPWWKSGIDPAPNPTLRID